MVRETLSQGYKAARRVAVGLIGGTVLLVGLALLVLPGPAVLVIPAGLAVLALEFAWARRWLDRVREVGRSAPGGLARLSTWGRTTMSRAARRVGGRPQVR